MAVILQRVRQTIFDVFGESIEGTVAERRSTIERSTYTGKDDPGQWCPEAAVVIHCEDGIDSGYYESFYMEKWFEVNDRLGDDYLVEHYNAAVIGVYEQ